MLQGGNVHLESHWLRKKHCRRHLKGCQAWHVPLMAICIEGEKAVVQLPVSGDGMKESKQLLSDNIFSL